jgi:hypothetical protein
MKRAVNRKSIGSGERCARIPDPQNDLPSKTRKPHPKPRLRRARRHADRRYASPGWASPGQRCRRPGPSGHRNHLQALIEAELTEAIGAVLHERTDTRTTCATATAPARCRPQWGIWSCGSRNCAPARSSPACLSVVVGWTRAGRTPCTRWPSGVCRHPPGRWREDYRGGGSPIPVAAWRADSDPGRPRPGPRPTITSRDGLMRVGA